MCCSDIGVHVSPSVMVFSWWMPRGGVVGSDGGSAAGFLRGLCTVFPGGCACLHSHQQ